MAAVFWGFFHGVLRLTYPGYSFLRDELIKEKSRAIKIFLLEDLSLLGVYSLSSLFLHLCLIIVEKKEILKRKLFYFLIYFPPFVMLFYSIFYDFYFTLRKIEFPKKVISFFDIFFAFYFELLLLIPPFLLIKKFLSLKNLQERKKMSFLLIAALIPAVFGSILPIFLKVIDFGWLTFLLYTVAYFFLVVGILKYKLFIDYREILENIFRSLTELAIVADNEGIILLTNEATSKKLGFKKEEIFGMKIEEILKGGKEKWNEFLDKLKKFGFLFEQKAFFLTKDKKEIPFLLNSSQIKGGIIFTGRDIGELIERQKELERKVKERTEELNEAKKVLEIKVQARKKELKELAESLEEQVKERTKELQKKAEELERFYKLAVERELKMVELKKEIERLKEKLEKSN